MENPAVPTLNIPEESPYGYVPTRWICILFLTFFSISTLGHVGQALYTRTWFMFLTVIIAGILEILGWSGRLWSSYSPVSEDPFLMQIVTTIIGPTPLLAANFVILGELIRRLGVGYSRLGPRLYTIIFCSFDIISLVVQAAGGAIASSSDDSDGSRLGGNIMLGGIAFQLFTISVYTLLGSEFLYRYAHDLPIRSHGTYEAAGRSSPTGTIINKPKMNLRLKLMVGALIFNTICLYIRAIYRTIELSDGWDGRIITTEVYFNVLDGAMIVLAMYTLNFFHPGNLVYRRHKTDKSIDSMTEQLEMN